MSMKIKLQKSSCIWIPVAKQMSTKIEASNLFTRGSTKISALKKLVIW